MEVDNEMLEALEALVEQFGAYRRGWMGRWQDRIMLTSDLDRAESVIRKAKSQMSKSREKETT